MGYLKDRRTGRSFELHPVVSASDEHLQEIAGGDGIRGWVTTGAGVALCALAVAVEVGACAVGTLAAGEITAAGVGL